MRTQLLILKERVLESGTLPDEIVECFPKRGSANRKLSCIGQLS